MSARKWHSKAIFYLHSRSRSSTIETAWLLNQKNQTKKKRLETANENKNSNDSINADFFSGHRGLCGLDHCKFIHRGRAIFLINAIFLQHFDDTSEQLRY